MDDRELRLECLKLAMTPGGLNTSGTIEVAEAFADFVSGADNAKSPVPIKPMPRPDDLK